MNTTGALHGGAVLIGDGPEELAERRRLRAAYEAEAAALSDGELAAELARLRAERPGSADGWDRMWALEVEERRRYLGALARVHAD